MITVLIILSSLSFIILMMGFFNIRLPFVKKNRKIKPSEKIADVTSAPPLRSGIRVTRVSKYKEEEMPARYSPNGQVRLIHLP